MNQGFLSSSDPNAHTNHTKDSMQIWHQLNSSSSHTLPGYCFEYMVTFWSTFDCSQRTNAKSSAGVKGRADLPERHKQFHICYSEEKNHRNSRAQQKQTVNLHSRLHQNISIMIRLLGVIRWVSTWFRASRYENHCRGWFDRLWLLELSNFTRSDLLQSFPIVGKFWVAEMYSNSNYHSQER